MFSCIRAAFLTGSVLCSWSTTASYPPSRIAYEATQSEEAALKQLGAVTDLARLDAEAQVVARQSAAERFAQVRDFKKTQMEPVRAV